MVQKFERLGRKLVYTGIRLRIYQDELKTPSGRIVKWDHIAHPGAAAVVPVTDDGKIIMVKQFRNSPDRITLEIPAGGRNEGEDFYDCAKRELEEECGYRSDDLEFLISVDTEIAFCNEQIDVFVAKNLIPSVQNLDPDEYIDLVEMEVDQLEEMIFDGTIKDSKTISAILAYKEKYLNK